MRIRQLGRLVYVNGQSVRGIVKAKREAVRSCRKTVGDGVEDGRRQGWVGVGAGHWHWHEALGI